MKREFHVFTTPHVGDPAWIIPVVEILGEKKMSATTDATELMKVAWKLQFDLGVQSGRVSEATRVRRYLERINWNEDQIRTLMFWKSE